MIIFLIPLYLTVGIAITSKLLLWHFEETKKLITYQPNSKIFIPFLIFMLIIDVFKFCFDNTIVEIVFMFVTMGTQIYFYIPFMSSRLKILLFFLASISTSLVWFTTRNVYLSNYLFITEIAFLMFIVQPKEFTEMFMYGSFLIILIQYFIFGFSHFINYKKVPMYLLFPVYEYNTLFTYYNLGHPLIYIYEKSGLIPYIIFVFIYWVMVYFLNVQLPPFLIIGFFIFFTQKQKPKIMQVLPV